MKFSIKLMKKSYAKIVSMYIRNRIAQNRAGLVVRINNWEHWIENKRPIRSLKTGFFVTLTRNCHLSQTATDKIFMRSPYKMFHQTRHDVIFNSKCPSKVYMYLLLPSIGIESIQAAFRRLPLSFKKYFRHIIPKLL